MLFSSFCFLGSLHALLSFLLPPFSSCCLPGTGPIFAAEVLTMLYIHWKNRVLKKKRSSIEGENFRLCIDFYMCCWVSLSDHRVPWGVSAWGIPLVPRTQRQLRKVSCLAWYRPEYSYIQTYMHIYIIKDIWYEKSAVKMVQLWALCLCEMLNWPIVLSFTCSTEICTSLKSNLLNY